MPTYQLTLSSTGTTPVPYHLRNAIEDSLAAICRALEATTYTHRQKAIRDLHENRWIIDREIRTANNVKPIERKAKRSRAQIHHDLIDKGFIDITHQSGIIQTIEEHLPGALRKTTDWNQRPSSRVLVPGWVRTIALNDPTKLKDCVRQTKLRKALMFTFDTVSFTSKD